MEKNKTEEQRSEQDVSKRE